MVKSTSKCFFFFFAECADRFYNSNCSGICGFCINDKICNKYNGSCPNGCLEHYKEPFCQGILIRCIYFICKRFYCLFEWKMGCILRNYWQTSLHNEHVFLYLPLLFIYSCTYINGVLQHMRPNVIFFMYNCTTFNKRYVDKIYVLIFKYKWRSSDRLIFVSYM